MTEDMDQFDKQMAEIDKAMAGMPDPPAQSGAAPAAAPTRRVAPVKPPRGSRTEVISVWVRLVLVTLLAAGLMVWPYPSSCGLGLMAYLGALGVAIGTGGWTAVSTWRLRLGLPHVVSLGVSLAGLGLLAHEIAQRTGYTAGAATWFCP